MTPESQPSGTAADAPPAALAASIVIPVHNKATLTRTCLNALLNEPDRRVEREIVVVDDGSTDLTGELLASYGDRIRVVRNDPGKGFAGAISAGVAAATHPLMVFLNNDTIPRTGWLTALVRYAHAHPEAGVVGAKLLYPNDTVQHAGVVIGQNGFPQHIYLGFPGDHPAVMKSRPFQMVTFACCLVRRETWQALDGFDAAFHNGWEDVDFCLRLRQRGGEVHYCHESIVYHFESSTRDPGAPEQRTNLNRFVELWGNKVRRDDFDYYLADGLIQATYPHRYPIQLQISPLLAGVAVGEQDRLGDRLLFDRAKQIAVLLRNNILLNLRVHEAELRTTAAENRLQHLSAAGVATDQPAPTTQQSREEPAADPAIPAEPAPPAPAPIMGRVEQPGRTPDVVTGSWLPISGWALSRAGIFAVKTVVDGVELGEVEYGEERPDVKLLFPDYENADRSGFRGKVPTESLSDGPHGITIRIIGNDGNAAELNTSFERDATAKATGRIIARLDHPRAGTVPTVRDRLWIQGSALSSRGIRELTCRVDGVAHGALGYGALRPDAGATHADFPNANHCGFSGVVPVDDLEPGEHEARIEIVSGNDLRTELVVPFVIDRSERELGEVPEINRQFPAWLQKHRPTAETVAALRAETDGLAFRPTISVVVPVGAATADVLEATVVSLVAQAYPAWEGMLVVGPDTPEDVRAAVEATAESDSRIVVLTSDTASPEAAHNLGLERAAGALVGLLPCGDLLWPTALGQVALALQGAPDADLVYGDEDKINLEQGVEWDPFFKPDWSPDLHLSSDYLGPFTLYRADLARDLGGLREDAAGAAAYDLALRATDVPRRVVHVPRIVTSRRAEPTAGPAPRDPRGVAAEQRALTEALARRGARATVEPGVSPGRWRVRHALNDTPAVTIVMPSGGRLEYLEPCVADLVGKTTYPNLHILVMDNSTGYDVANVVDATFPRFPRIRRVPIDLKPFNFSALINRAIPHVETPYTILLNDDMTVITPDWVETMLEQAQRPEVGIVGPKLLYPDGTIQHAGVILGPYDGTCHAFKQFPGNHAGWFGIPNVIRNTSAITFACGMMRTSLFAEVGGLDEANLPIAFNDVDFCLRVSEAGYRIVYTPHAVLYHHESVTKVAFTSPSEVARLRSRWGHVIAHDPYYNPNLTRTGEDCSLNMA